MKKLISAKVTKAFPGKPDDETQVREVAVGETISGELAKVAIGEGWAEEIAADAAEDAAPPTAKKPHAGRKGK